MHWNFWSKWRLRSPGGGWRREGCSLTCHLLLSWGGGGGGGEEGGREGRRPLSTSLPLLRSNPYLCKTSLLKGFYPNLYLGTSSQTSLLPLENFTRISGLSHCTVGIVLIYVYRLKNPSDLQYIISCMGLIWAVKCWVYIGSWPILAFLKAVSYLNTN